LEVAPGTDLSGVLTQAARGHNERFGRILFASNGTLSPNVIVLANDELISRRQPPLLRDGDAVSLIPAISGG
jgi:molybdopterin converting factor small subunit